MAEGNSSSEALLPPRELVVIVKPDLGLRTTVKGLDIASARETAPSLADFLRSTPISIKPLFGTDETRLKLETASLMAETSGPLPDLSVFYRVDAPDTKLDQLAKSLRQLDTVEAAYVKPPAELPRRIKPPAELPRRLNDMTPLLASPPVTPDFESRQGYLNAAPAGIDARYAWTLPGGRGTGVNIIDIEGAWRFTHEDVLQNQGGVVGGTQSTDLRWRNHGTAVVGVFGGDQSSIGITGISPDSDTRAISIFGAGMGSAVAIRQAANMLRPGDIILIELHRPGPRFNFQQRDDQLGYIAIEWWEDDFAAIQYATGRGVIVVEAAGNGAENLDDAIYNTRPAGFPTSWTNAFNRANRDSGAIVVGAGAPPSGNHGPDRSRLDFSNYGALIDAQGWGREVTTCGYGDLQGGVNEDVWYTGRFSGTSSASPIVVGAISCTQGIVRARGITPVTPAATRACLRSTGSTQQDAPGRPASQRIGNRPNLRQLINCALGKEQIKEIKEVKEKDIKDVIKEKDITDVIKERKEFTKGEIKESKEKDIKEKDKDFVEGRRIIEGRVMPGHPRFHPSRYAEERIEKLESEVSELAHFIGVELRPKLQESPLSHEPDIGREDLQSLSARLQKQASDAKQLKDGKDVEKLQEG
jgi:Subtilase family